MQKNKVIVLCTLTIALVIALAIGFTYAYFASDVSSSNNLNTTINVANDPNIEFNLVGGSDVSFNLDGQMYEGNVSDTGILNTSTFNVTLNANSGITCSYDLYYVWKSGDTYTKTSGATKEFTIELNSTYGNVAETQVPVSSTKLGTFSITTGGTLTTQTWTVNTRFYNLNLNQDAHSGKSYNFKIEARNVSCSQSGA